jgi:hypothetical protein
MFVWNNFFADPDPTFQFYMDPDPDPTEQVYMLFLSYYSVPGVTSYFLQSLMSYLQGVSKSSRFFLLVSQQWKKVRILTDFYE